MSNCINCERLKSEIAILEARLRKVVTILEPEGPPIPGGIQDKENRFYYRFGRQLHARARAIAEGRES